MKKSNKIFLISMVIVIVGLLVFIAIDGGKPGQLVCSECGKVVAESCVECEEAAKINFEKGITDTLEEIEIVTASSNYYSSWVSLLAPVIAIALALITKEVYSSLMIGIVVGGLFACNFRPVKTIDSVVQDGFIEAISGTAGIFAFLVILGAIVALVNKAGGSAAFGRWASTHIKSRAGAMLCTFVLGVLIFIDDYFNCLTVGGVMRPVTDSHKISRAKLAYIIDATAAPVCMIAPISSWAAAVSKFAADGEGIKLFVQAIPYNLYSLLTLGFIVAIVLMKLDYGPMRIHEMNALKGDLMTSGKAAERPEEEPYNTKGRVIDLVLPVLVLVVVCVFAMVYIGGFFGGECAGDFIAAFGNTDATIGLPLGGLVALIVTIAYLMIRRIVTFGEAMSAIPKGFVAMVPAILILTLATSLKNMTGLLGADVYVGELMQGAAAGLANFLPAIIFLVAIALSFSTGTSWGTFGILIPIVMAIFEPTSELLIIGMSACLAGSVCGDHCSPISDTTIMSSAGAQCDHVNHVSTQLPYTLTVASISFVGYILAGFVQNVFVVLGVSFALMMATLFVVKFMQKKQTV